MDLNNHPTMKPGGHDGPGGGRLSAGERVGDERGGMMEFVMQIPPENGRIFGAAYLFVSEDEARLIELQQKLSRYIALGLPKTEEG